MRCIDDIHHNRETGPQSTTYFTRYSQNRWALCTVVVQLVVLLDVLRIPVLTMHSSCEIKLIHNVSKT